MNAFAKADTTKKKNVHRIEVELRRLSQAREKRPITKRRWADLLVAQSALTWAIDPKCCAAPFDFLKYGSPNPA
jgi:hypothetical protein